MKAPRSLKFGRNLTARQWTAISILQHIFFDGNKCIENEIMGRGATKIESFEDAQPCCAVPYSMMIFNGLIILTTPSPNRTMITPSTR